MTGSRPSGARLGSRQGDSPRADDGPVSADGEFYITARLAGRMERLLARDDDAIAVLVADLEAAASGPDPVVSMRAILDAADPEGARHD